MSVETKRDFVYERVKSRITLCQHTFSENFFSLIYIKFGRLYGIILIREFAYIGQLIACF